MSDKKPFANLSESQQTELFNEVVDRFIAIADEMLPGDVQFIVGFCWFGRNDCLKSQWVGSTPDLPVMGIIKEAGENISPFEPLDPRRN